ncbi:MAG: biopolymer transporter ExbD [Myxococcales bacterium]|nr:biopolymer transporter ExbD [Myxococcales bacterium]MCB9581874.1 biopolymer transporter ExbD [Polyangiaceae bacterium]
MGASLQSSGRSKQPEPEINVTPLVDVVLVLLIIFMVIAPALNQGEHVELPAILQPDAKPKDMNPIEVTLALNGNVLLDKERVDPSELEAKVRELHKEDPDRALMLLTDEAMPYKKVRTVFAKLQGMGFKGLSLKVTEKKKAGAS